MAQRNQANHPEHLIVPFSLMRTIWGAICFNISTVNDIKSACGIHLYSYLKPDVASSGVKLSRVANFK